MTPEPSLESYLDALREDLPSEGTQARLQQRLASAGIGISLALMTKTATASCVAKVAKVGIVSALSARFAGLPLLWQMGLVTATTAAVATGPLMVMTKTPEVRSHDAAAVALRGSSSMTGARAPSLDIPNRDDGTVRTDDAPVLASSAPSIDAAPRLRAAERRVDVAASTQDAQELRTLAEETRLIDRALAAVRAGNLDDAARELDEHDRRFPNGRLRREQRRAREKLEEARHERSSSVSNPN
jgi:hypothetical protein